MGGGSIAPSTCDSDYATRNITINNCVDDQVYLKDATDNFKKSAMPRLPKKTNEKELTILMHLRVEYF